MIESSLTHLIRGEAGTEDLPDILAYLSVPAIVALCCTCLASRKVAYSCNKLVIHSADEQGVELATKSSQALKKLMITSASRVAQTTNQGTPSRHPEEIMMRMFATIRSGVLHYLQELTVHVSLRAPWASITRNLFHDAVKIGSLLRLKQLDYRVDGSSEDDLIADICTYCPQLESLRLMPTHLWHRNPQAKLDFIAMITQPCWPKLETLELESYAFIHNFPYTTPEALANTLNKTRFPSLTGMVLTLKGNPRADHFLWDVISHPHATVMSRVREVQLTTAPTTRGDLWSQDSYSNLPWTVAPNLQKQSMLETAAQDSASDLREDMADTLRKLQLSSLQSLQFSKEIVANFAYNVKDLLESIHAHLTSKLSVM